MFFCSTFYFLLRGVKTKRRLECALGGAFFGLGFYSYISYRVMPLVLLVILPLLLLGKTKTDRKPLLRGIWLYLGSALVTALPLGLYFLRYPQQFFSRTSTISVFQLEHPWAQILSNILKTLLMFNLAGDINPRHNLPGRAQLNPVAGLFFLVGLVVLAAAVWRGIRRRKWAQTVPAALLLSALFIFLLPPIFTRKGVPQSLQTIGALAPAFLIAGYGLKVSGNKLIGWIKRRNVSLWPVSVLLAALLALITWQEYRAAFIDFPNYPDLENHFTNYQVNIGHYLNAVPEGVDRYVLTNYAGAPADGHPNPAQPVMFITQRDPEITYLLLRDLPTAIEDKNQPFVITPLRYQEELLGQVEEKLNMDLTDAWTENDVYLIYPNNAFE